MHAYLFDFDGTLVDSAPDLTRALDQALARAGLPGVGLELGKKMVGHGAGHLVERALRHTTGDSSHRIDSPFGQLMLSTFLELYEPICAETSTLYPGAIEVLDTLAARGKQLGMVTNKPRRFVERMVPAFGLTDRFDVVVAGDDLPVKKPNPEMVWHALQALECAPEDACLIGDSQADLGAASASGVTSILVSFGYSGDLDVTTAGASRVIDQLTDVLHDT
jgi:phosphoglycolate phosphatase